MDTVAKGSKPKKYGVPVAKGAKANKRKRAAAVDANGNATTPDHHNFKAFNVRSARRANLQETRTAERQEAKYHVPLANRRKEDDSAPMVVAVQGPPGCGKTTLIRCLVKHYTKQNIKSDGVKGPVTVVAGKKKRIIFFEVGNDMNSMIDASKVADLVLLMVDAHFGFEMETFEFLNLLQTHGFPKVMGIFSHVDGFEDATKVRKTKKKLKQRFWTEVAPGAKVFYFSGLIHGMYPKREILNLSRYVTGTKFRPISWRTRHPYMLVDRMEDKTPQVDITASNGKCDRLIALHGYIQGTHIKPGQRIHISGAGDFDLREIAVLEDPCATPRKVDENGEPIKRKTLNDRDKLLHAPMADIGGLSYDQEDVYINIPDRYVVFSDLPTDDANLGGGHDDKLRSAIAQSEGVRMVKELQKSRTVNAKPEGAGISLLAGGPQITKFAFEREFSDARDADDERTGQFKKRGNEISPVSSDSDSDESLSSEVKPNMEVEIQGEQIADRIQSSDRGIFTSLDPILHHTVMPGKNALHGSNLMELVYGSEGTVYRSTRGGLSNFASPGPGSRFSYSQTVMERWLTMRKDADNSSSSASLSSMDSDSQSASSSDDDERASHSGDDADTTDPERVVGERSPDMRGSIDLLQQVRYCFINRGELGRSTRRNIASDDDFEDLEVSQVPDTSPVHRVSDSRIPTGKGGGDISIADDIGAVGELTDGEWEKLKMLKAQLQADFDKNDNGGSDDSDQDESRANVHPSITEKDEMITFYEQKKREITARMQRNEEEFAGLSPVMRARIDGAPIGSYVRLVVRDVPAEFVSNFNPRAMCIAGGLIAGEDQLGYLKVRFKKHRWFPKILKTRDPLIFSAGWRRWQSLPVYYVEDPNGRHRMLKYTPEHMHCEALVWGPQTPPATGLIACQSISPGNQRFRISATGTVLTMEQSSRVTKKLKLIGTPYQIMKHTAFIKGMFSSALEVSRFEGASLRTSSGIRGQIKKAVLSGGTGKGSKGPNGGIDGNFRATFEDKILMSDIVFLRAWVNVDIPKLYNPILSLLASNQNVSSAATVEQEAAITQKDKSNSDIPVLMRGNRQLRQDEQVPIPIKKDSEYLPVARTDKTFLPLKIPRALQESLPYSSKPKLDKARASNSSKLLLTRRAVVLDGQERKLHALVQQLNTIRNERKRIRDTAAERRRGERVKLQAREEASLQIYRADMRKEKMRERGKREQVQKRAREGTLHS